MNGDSEALPRLKIGRYLHACGRFTNSDGDIVSSVRGKMKLEILRFFANRNNLQVYIVTGGMGGGEWYGYALASTETLVKKRGTAWQYARDLPIDTRAMSGVSLDNGDFLLVGQYNL